MMLTDVQENFAITEKTNGKWLKKKQTEHDALVDDPVF